MSKSAVLFIGAVLIFTLVVWQSGSSSALTFVTGYGLLIAQFGWSFTSSAKKDSEEIADATYFLGFIMTMIYLAFGLSESASGGSALSEKAMAKFIADLATALSYTIVGLALRQGNILSLAAKDRKNPQELSAEALAATTTALREVATTLTGVTSGISSLLGEPKADEREPVTSRLQKLVDKFEASVDSASTTMTTSVGKFGTTTNLSLDTLTRAMTSLSSEMTQTAQNIQLEIKDLFKEVRDQRASLVRLAGLVAGQLNTQLTNWEAELVRSRDQLHAVRKSTDEESKKALESISVSSVALNNLAGSVVKTVNSLPDPSKHLTSVWETLAKREETLAASTAKIESAVSVLQTKAIEATTAVGGVASALSGSAAQIKQGGSSMNATLESEAKQVRATLDELLRLIEHRITTIKR